MRRGVLHLWAVVSLNIALLLSTSTVYADIGPAPPTMDFSFEYHTQQTVIASGQLLLCEDATCTKSEPFINPLDILGRPAIFNCDDVDRCWAWAGARGFKQYHKLVITFADKTRESNAFTKIAYGAQYVVIVNEDSLSIYEVFLPSSLFNFFSPLQTLCFAPALILTLIIETTVATTYSRKVKTPVKRVGWANVISLLIVWFGFPYLQLGYIAVLILAELFAMVFEAAFLHIANRKTGLSFRRASIVSVLMNVASIGAGIGTILLFIAWVSLSTWLATSR